MNATGGLWFLLILAALFAVAELWRRANRCFYCGGVNQHDVGCPLNLDRERRP